MPYRLMFMEWIGGGGEPSENPPEYLIAELQDGVVRGAVFVERDKPAAIHNADRLEEDDDFLSVGSGVWEYDIRRWPRIEVRRRAHQFANGARLRSRGRIARAGIKGYRSGL